MPAFSLGVTGRRVLAVGLLLLVVAVALWRHAHAAAGGASSASALRVQPVAGGSTRAGAARSPVRDARIVVDVAGAVRRPGLVRLPPGSRVADAVARAGGLARRADRDGVNLAAPVSDGQQVLVPSRAAAGTSAPSPGASATGSPSAGPVSLSAATAEQLDTLPGIGPVTAQKIVDYRTQHGAFHSVDELDAIPGIGPARISELQGLVVP